MSNSIDDSMERSRVKYSLYKEIVYDNRLFKPMSQIFKKERVLIRPHKRPDGDCVGSAIALMLALKNAGYEAVIQCPDECPDNLKFLPKTEFFSTEVPKGKFDIIFYVDSHDTSSTSNSEVEGDPVTVNIDHHQTNALFAKHNVVDPDSPSCSMMIKMLLDLYGFKIDADIAFCIMAGIIFDTGGLKNLNTTPEALRVVAEMSEICDRSFLEIVSKMYAISPESFINRMNLFSEIKFENDGKIAWLFVEKPQKDRVSHMRAGEEMRDIEGVQASVVFKPIGGGMRVSFRSVEIDVSAVAQELNPTGGGHKLAAAVSLTGEKDEIIKNVIEKLTEKIDGKVPETN